MEIGQQVENSSFRVSSMLQFPDFSRKGFDIEKYNSRFVQSNFIIHVRSKEASFPTHWGSLAIKCAFNGAEFYQAKSGVFAADQNRFLILNNGTEYASWIDAQDHVESLAISFCPSFEQEVLSTLKLSHATLIDDPAKRMETHFRFMERLYPYNEPIKDLVFKIRAISSNPSDNKEVLEELFYRLMENMLLVQSNMDKEISSIQKLKPSTRKELFKRLVRAKDFMYSCYDQHISLAQMAQTACLNEYYFLREFKRAYTVTPHQYLTNRRMEVAFNLLRGNRHSVSEICGMVGFSDPASFSKLFKKSFGHSPLAFRKSG